MKRVIERIYKRTTEYSHPSQATTTANALDLLSSGIYTEEERFIFELLQNAVDSFDGHDDRELRIKIILTDDLLIFMHNGTPFSERDLEGLCDIGNGNKMNDAKKIGYKGIGFKSVFMHSHLVTVLTNGTCFKFDKDACENVVKEKGAEYAGVRMPWQIIPMLTNIPSDIDTSGFNVVTYIQTYNKKSLRRKVEKLLADTRFLLFLKVDNLRISFYDGEQEILKLSKSYKNNVLTLLKNNIPQNRWLIHSKEVKLPSEIKKTLVHDTKVPTKLKESESVEISFAIALDEDGSILPLKDAVIYTYLPTSYSIGLSFVVNANFITDAGRQQITKDCSWNEFIFSQIPELYLNWIAEDVALHNSGWYKVLPYHLSHKDELSDAYSQSLDRALKTIPFVKVIDGSMLLPFDSVVDKIGFSSAIPYNTFNRFIHNEVKENSSYESLVSAEVGNALTQYGISQIDYTQLYILLEKSEQYMGAFSDEEILQLLSWLKDYSLDKNTEFKRKLSYSKILFDENRGLIEPIACFFPSEYSDDNPDITEDAKIIKQSLSDSFDDDMTNWLKDLGVQEMSNITVIDKVLCEEKYISVDNAIDVLRFIYECNKKENIFNNISKYRLENIKILTNGGRLLYASELYLSDCYNPICKIQQNYPEDIFVSDLYPKNTEDCTEWSLFLQKLGCANDIKLSRIKYDEGTWVMQNSSIQRCVQKAKNSEYNTALDGRKFYLGCAGGLCIYAESSPLISLKSSELVYDFYKLFWERIFSNTDPSNNNDCIFGNTGFGYTKSALLSGSSYLGKTFIEWLINSKELLPATDGKLYTISNILMNSDTNLNVFGKYYPVFAISKPIRNTWIDKLPFKKDLTLMDYLTVLDRISQDDINETTSNKDRINLIYERMSDNWDFSRDSSNYIQLQNWGKTHKILSKDGEFESPSSLYLLATHLLGIELNNQVYHGKHLENSRFASMMEALGVSIIADHQVNGLDDAIINLDITNKLLLKSEFLTTIAVSDTFTIETWEESYTKMKRAIKALEFYQADCIRISYGNQEFEKTVYSKEKKFYYVGKFGVANQELLHGAIMKAIDIPLKARTIFLTILQMDNLMELKDFIKQKGYDTSYITIPQEIIEASKLSAVNNATIGTRLNGSEVATIEQIAENEEAKQLVLKKLKNEGFDISNANSDFSVVNGVVLNNTNYPLVVKSCKNQEHRIWINPNEWQQLFKPNSMLWLHFGGGVVAPIKAHELFTYQDKLTLSFDSMNLMMDDRIHKIMEVLHYFNKVHLDLVSLNPNKQRADDMEQYLFNDNNNDNSNLESSPI